MKLRPDAGFGLAPQPTPAGAAGAAELLGRDLSPGAAGDQNMDDAGQRRAIVTRQPSGWRNRRGGRGGSSGYTRYHNPSRTSSETRSSTTSSVMPSGLRRPQPVRN